MNVPTLVFRYRLYLFLALYLLGFSPPWEWGMHSSHGTLWLALSTLLARTGWFALDSATVTVTCVALVCLVVAAILRVWGTANLGSTVMRNASMQGAGLTATGPYRFVRNPLYLGSSLQALGIAILMPPSGAAFFLPAFAVVVLVLISAEEQFLSARLGEAYQHYRSLIPRIVPRILPRLLPRSEAAPGPSPVPPQWAQAFLAETFPVTFALCFAALAWRYNAHTLIRCLLICYGLSLVTRAFVSQRRDAQEDSSVQGRD